MAISQKTVSSFEDKDISVFKLRNTHGNYVEICNYGATLLSFVITDKFGTQDNIILSYNNIESYFEDNYYIGSTIGRFANRIANAQFELNGKLYFLDKNDGRNSNHGGFKSINTKIFDSEIKENRLRLSYVSKDGENGFPGNLRFSVTYSFSDKNELEIQYEAYSDKDTWFNPTNHAYFNLNPQSETILEHQLKVFADSYLENNEEFIPTGKIRPLSDPGFDFRKYQTLSEMMSLKSENIQGYNTYFISSSEENMKKHASLREIRTERMLDVYSTMPGIQIYTGDYLGKPFHPFAGIAMESQFYPDSPNHPGFPSCKLSAGKEVEHTILFRATTGCF